MGLKSGKDWYSVCAKNKNDDEERVRKGFPPRFSEMKFNNPENIKTSPAAEAWITAHRTPLDEEGCQRVHTARGKRRRLARGK